MSIPGVSNFVQAGGSAASLLGGMATAANPAMGAAMAVGGAVKAIGSLFGGGKRRREQRAAQAELAKRKSEYESLDTSNPYKNLTNTYENLTVNTQAADFAAQQSSQGAANIMNNLAAAAGGGAAPQKPARPRQVRAPDSTARPPPRSDEHSARRQDCVASLHRSMLGSLFSRVDV